jgi:hypothetical protein
MKNLQKLVLAGVIATTTGFVMAAPIYAQETEPPQIGFAHGADYYAWQMEQYSRHIARMSPEDRVKLAAMQDKLMLMEMDQQSAVMKMDMDIAKARHQVEMFILSTGNAQGH